MTARQDIIQIVTQLEAGGAQRCAVENAREFRKRGFTVETWFLYAKREAFAGEPGIRCLLDRKPEGFADYIRILWRLYGALKSARPSILFTYSHYANVLGCLIGLLAGVPARIANQTGLPERIPAVARWLDLWFGTTGIYSANIANSRTTFDALAGRPPGYLERLRLVPNGVSLPVTSPDARMRVREELGIRPDEVLFLTAGRLAAVKNHDRLIRAFETAGGAMLLIAGDGECRQEIEALAGGTNGIFLSGEVSPERLSEFYAAADVFILPSLWESFGLVAVEAAAAGLPIAASDIPALREVLTVDGKSAALFFDPESEAAIAATVTRLSGDAALREDLARRSAGVAGRYSTAAMADGFLEAAGHAR